MKELELKILTNLGEMGVVGSDVSDTWMRVDGTASRSPGSFTGGFVMQSAPQSTRIELRSGKVLIAEPSFATRLVSAVPDGYFEVRYVVECGMRNSSSLIDPLSMQNFLLTAIQTSSQTKFVFSLSEEAYENISLGIRSAVFGATLNGGADMVFSYEASSASRLRQRITEAHDEFVRVWTESTTQLEKILGIKNLKKNGFNKEAATVREIDI